MTKDTLPGIDSDKIVKNTGSIDLVGKENKRKKGKPKFDFLALKDGESDLEMKNDYDDCDEEDEDDENDEEEE